VLKLAQYSISRALAKGAHVDASKKSRPADWAFLQRGNMLIMSLVENYAEFKVRVCWVEGKRVWPGRKKDKPVIQCHTPLPINLAVKEHVKSGATEMKQVNHHITRSQQALRSSKPYHVGVSRMQWYRCDLGVGKCLSEQDSRYRQS
jgi:hypothetical protein